MQLVSFGEFVADKLTSEPAFEVELFAQYGEFLPDAFFAGDVPENDLVALMTEEQAARINSSRTSEQNKIDLGLHSLYTGQSVHRAVTTVQHYRCRVSVRQLTVCGPRLTRRFQAEWSENG